MPANSISLSAVLRAATDAELPSGQLSSAESVTLVQTLGSVPDPRHRRGRRHRLQSVLLLALGTVLAGAHSYAAIADWAAHAGQAVAVCGRPPHARTVRRLLSQLDPTALEAALTGWVPSRRQAAVRNAAVGDPLTACRPVLAVDGKTLRGARGPEGWQAKLVCVYDHVHRRCHCGDAVVTPS